jgi:hypothetical protein
MHESNNSSTGRLNKPAILAWIISLAGMTLWLYGYFVTGNTSLIDWRAYTPWWIADFLPNIESEIGLALVCVGSVLGLLARSTVTEKALLVHLVQLSASLLSLSEAKIGELLGGHFGGTAPEKQT